MSCSRAESESPPGGQQEIAFSFNLQSDTSQRVTQEMVKELNLPPSAQMIIEHLIQGQGTLVIVIGATSTIAAIMTIDNRRVRH
jgi:hypothetical protein